MATAIDDPTKPPADTTLQQSTLPIAKTPAPTAPSPLPVSTQPAGTGTLAPTSFGDAPAPVAPDPLATTDPMAFQPAPGSIPNTQSYIPGTSSPTSPGVLGQQYVPGSNNGLIDLGGGQLAPAVNGQSTMTILDPIKTQGYQAPGTQTAQGTIVGSTYDENGNPVPVYDGGPTNPNVQTTASAPLTGQQQMSSFLSLLSPNSSASNGGGLAPSGAIPSTPSSGLGSATMPAGTPAAANPGSSPTPGSAGTNPATAGAGGTGGTLPNSFLPAQSASEAANNGYNLTPTTPQNALTNSTITPGPGTDRYAIAKQQLADFTKQSEPAYEAALRDANRYNFASGRGVSGIANNSIGDLQLQRENNIRSQSNSVMENALNGSIEDAYRNLGIAQQQQGFQAGQQQTAFGQGLATQQLSDTEKNAAFSQALQQLLAGSSGDPSQVALVLSQIFGSQGNAAGNAANNYATASNANSSATSQADEFKQWLQGIITSGQLNNILGQGVPDVQATPNANGGYG